MIKDFNKVVGSILRERRKEKGFSLEYVASFLGVTKNAVSNWEIGKRSLYAETLREYCKILGCSMQDIFNEIDEADSL